MPVHVKIANVWRQIVNSYVRVTGSWRESQVLIKRSGVWSNTTPTPPNTTSLTQNNSADGTYTLTTAAYSTAGAGTHLNTDWQIAETSDTGFATPVYQSLTDTSNLTSITLSDKGLTDGKQYIARARHRSNTGSTASWSASYAVFTPPAVSFSGSAYNSHSYTTTAYSGLSGFTHNNSDYALTRTTDTSFTGTAYSVTAQAATSYTNTTNLVGSSSYRIRMIANFSGSRTSPAKIATVTTGAYTYNVTYTSNTTWTSPYGPSSAVNIYVEVAGGRGGGSCQSGGRGRVFGMTLPLTSNTNYYAYPGGVGGGGGAACGGGGGAAAVFATTSNQAYLIGGGGGGVRQCCHCCNCACDGCGGGGGATSGGNGVCGTCCGCGSGGGTWGGTRLGSGVTDSGEIGINASCCSDCNGGNSHAYGTLSTNSLNTGGPYVNIRY
jgi:hypothetical protein